MTPRSLDEARRLLPHIGFAVYAYEPGGAVVLELHNHGEVAVSFTAATEREAWEQAFPEVPPPPEPAADFFD